MTIDIVFYTQIGSVITFLFSLFGLYKLLVSSKDATIETLKQQINFLELKVKSAAEIAPDMLLLRYEKRSSLLEKELAEAEKEKEPLIAEIEDLKKKVLDADSKSQQQNFLSQLIAVSQHLSLVNSERQELLRRLRDTEEPYIKFLHHANADISPGRRRIVGDIVSYLNVDWVISANPQELQSAVGQITKETRNAGMHPKIPINGGALTGLNSVGIINDRDELTLLGVSVFKSIAKEMKSNKSSHSAS